MSRRKATVRPKRTKQTASKQLKALQDGIATAIKQLNDARENVGVANSFVFICIQALLAQRGDDVVPDVATVLEAAYDRLTLDLNRNLRDALQALDQGDAS